MTLRGWIRRRRFVVATLVLLACVGTVVLLPLWLPRALGIWRQDLVFAVPDAGRKIFVTIDDSPSLATKDILRVLAEHDVRATFFITGSRVRDPAELEAIRAGGHELAHHLLTTRACSQLSQEEFEREFDHVHDLLAAAGGVPLFRPPSDFGTRQQIAYAQGRGYRAVVGTIYPLDHWLEDPARIRRIARWLATNGGILIMHDGSKRGPRTAAVLAELLPDLREAGFTFGNLAAELAETEP